MPLGGHHALRAKREFGTGFEAGVEAQAASPEPHGGGLRQHIVALEFTFRLLPDDTGTLPLGARGGDGAAMFRRAAARSASLVLGAASATGIAASVVPL
jgi:hypothetical protein